jgi:hypothetical protein
MTTSTTTYCGCESPIIDIDHDEGCRRCGLPVNFSPTLKQRVAELNLEVQLTGRDGKAFAILGACRDAIRKGARENGFTQDEAIQAGTEFFAEATASDYDHLLRTAMEWLVVN